MNILFDINHPAHVHLFRNAINILKEKGHTVIITSREKDLTVELLDKYNYQHTVLSRAQKGLIKLGFELIWRQLRLLPILLRNKIQICISVTGACNVHVCKVLGIPTFVFYDTEHAKLQNKLTLPFVTKFFTPKHFNERYGKNHETYNGVHDLAYLHPKYFTPDKSVYGYLNINSDDKFVIIRFVSWQAAHDIGEKGIPLDLKRKIVKLCSQHARVFITSEAKIDKEFEEFRFPISPEKMHDALSFATMYIGEGGSMATEAAVLGTPSIFISTLTAGVFDEYEKNYDLIYSYSPNEEEKILRKVEKLLKNNEQKSIWLKKRDRFLLDKIDVTQFIVKNIMSYKKI